MDFGALKADAAGLVTVVAQDIASGEIRMVAHANREAVDATLATHEAHFFSRSRNSLWKKGESSGNVLRVREVWVDCDRDALLYLVEPNGPSCHTGAESCFFERIDVASDPGRAATADAAKPVARPTLALLQHELEARKSGTSAKSYTRSLLDGGAPKIGAKVIEEADEFVRAMTNETDDRVVGEAADVLYHVMVGLVSRGLSIRDVELELQKRFGVSGHVEKASRNKA